jgi:hypothetical protein
MELSVGLRQALRFPRSRDWAWTAGEAYDRLSQYRATQFCYEPLPALVRVLRTNGRTVAHFSRGVL